MRIINIDKKSKIQNAAFWIIALIFTFCISDLCLGQNDKVLQAQDYIKESQEYYQRAVGIYKNLIAQGKDLDRLHFELGKLYFSYGEFLKAIEEFKNTEEPLAKKFLAVSYYHLGNFTDALEVFNREEIPDDEYLYYQGLTCEKLNLFDQALEAYKKIKDEKFKAEAKKRIEIIERKTGSHHIRNLDPDVNRILLNAPSPGKYPQAGALILFCDEKIEITADGRQISYLHYIIKILNERGKENFSETSIGYDSTYEKVELEYARTIKPDGEVVDVGSRHIRDVSKYLNFPLYSNARAYIISFPEIIEGASIEYKVKVYRNKLINDKDFILSYPVQSSEPIIAANFTISIPAHNPLHIKNLNEKYNNFGANLIPIIKEKGGFLTYSWHFNSIPQIIPESIMPASVEINPTILISSFDSWQDIYMWWWNLTKDKIKEDAIIKEKVKELIRDKNSEEAKARAIYNYCAQKIRYVAVEYGQAGYEPHKAEDIFRYKYGDCKDQAILLVTLLKEAGFCAWPVLIATKEYYNLNEDFPAIFFNHCIVALALKDKIVFLDPTAETCPLEDLPAGDQGRKVMIFEEKGYKIQDTPLYPGQHNLNKQYLKMKINNDESLAAEKTVFTYGIYDQAQRAWLLYTPPELIEETFKEKIQDVSIGATLEKYEIKNLDNLNVPILLTYTFKGPEYFTNAGNLRIMPQLAGVDASLVAKDKRKYPLDFEILDSKELIFEIEIPQGFTVKYIPDSVVEDSPWLKFSVTYERKDNKIYFRQSTELKKNVVYEEEYADFKDFFKKLAKKIKQRIVLEKIK